MRRQGGRLFELAVVVAVLSMLAGCLLVRVPPLIARSERVAFQHVRGQLQSALLLEAADRIARGESRSLAGLAGENPMALLLKPPGNYAGAFRRPAAAGVRRSSWYFDETTRRLVYRPGRFADIETAQGPAEQLEFEIELVYDDRDADGAFDAARDGFGGLTLTPVREFEWRDPEV